MTRGIVAFVTILGILPALARWTINGSMSIQTAGLLMILMVALLSLGSRGIAFTGPVIAVLAFGLQYAPQQTWKGIWYAVASLLPLAIGLFGIYLMLASFRKKRCRRSEMNN